MRFPLLIYIHICFPDLYHRAPIASYSSPGTSTAPPRLLTWATRSATLDGWENEQSQPWLYPMFTQGAQWNARPPPTRPH